MPRVRLATTERDVRRCHAVMKQLRPHLDEDAFVAAVGVQRKEGFRLAYVEERGDVVAVAGFRVTHMLHQGRYLYLDDLITDETRRSRGHGKTLMDWLLGEARRERCAALELDSGVRRAAAHRFYFTQGLHIDSYHFRIPLAEPSPRLIGEKPAAGAARRARRRPS